MVTTLIGKTEEAIQMIFDKDTFQENVIGTTRLDPELAPPVMVGQAMLDGEVCSVLANNSRRPNPRFRVVYSGILGMEEAYKFSQAIYATIDADKDRPKDKKRPIILLIDTPGNSPGKIEEIVGMTKGTASYQFAIEDARLAGHPVIGMIIGRAVSGGFLCHGLLSDRILALPKEYGTIVHVMPTTSIAVITKIPLERLNELVKTNPVFASGAEFFYDLGGIDEMVKKPEEMRTTIIKTVKEVRDLRKQGKDDQLGIWHRGEIGAQRGGRKKRMEAIKKMQEEYEKILPELL
ncbi:MAG: acetyl-CoA carboxylase carboxyltransferase subunit alpha [Candidatus Methanofastidiosum methylothiophilum]|uniref:Acetyl-CoA carboxylase carboxyltransferase subunit alpha n=1 Tax=Candidatus Methanofastidiosum methylothiophilum TaxID=1705564 RepID=A0A150IHI7_9EURY|nr:MAG: acetyl-CoA carboxylase carboxyltransferase subunit alpha [Candidatus Methanofastidiosum methylthiophilus]KYC50334.1 MAG: acetyl-CoA carboxylase carboxyltransferase subunit alpha [Candidatus Methanofastidiosum methylthiophilus]